jgi:hypothetical protein
MVISPRSGAGHVGGAIPCLGACNHPNGPRNSLLNLRLAGCYGNDAINKNRVRIMVGRTVRPLCFIVIVTIVIVVTMFAIVVMVNMGVAARHVEMLPSPVVGRLTFAPCLDVPKAHPLEEKHGHQK